MKVTFSDPAIEHVSGRCGQMLYKTFKRADGTKETRVYFLPKQANGKYGYGRRTKPSEAETRTRAKFAQVSRIIKNMPGLEKIAYHKQWVKDKYKFKGKKYSTLNGYIRARIYAEFKASEGLTEGADRG